MKIVILAGGGGIRLFPLSRTYFPKQFLNLGDKNSLLNQTIKRFLSVAPASDIIIVTNKDYIHYVQAELADCSANEAHVVLEPVGRNTAPAIALATAYCKDVLGCGAEEVIFVTPSDHIVRYSDAFLKCIQQAEEMALQNKLVTFGIKPTKPETGYGYIEVGNTYCNGFIVNSFKEKPDKATAEKYVASHKYYWNSGIFAFTAGHIMKEIQKHQPEIATLLAKGYQTALENFDTIPNISIDYAIAEKSKTVVTIPCTAYWNDIGSWDAIYEAMVKDEAGNLVTGDCVAIDCTNTLMLSNNRLIAGIGLENLLIVETNDVIVICKQGQSQKVKELVDKLKKCNRPEVDRHTTINYPCKK